MYRLLVVIVASVTEGILGKDAVYVYSCCGFLHTHGSAPEVVFVGVNNKKSAFGTFLGVAASVQGDDISLSVVGVEVADRGVVSLPVGHGGKLAGAAVVVA